MSIIFHHQYINVDYWHAITTVVYETLSTALRILVFHILCCSLCRVWQKQWSILKCMSLVGMIKYLELELSTYCSHFIILTNVKMLPKWEPYFCDTASGKRFSCRHIICLFAQHCLLLWTTLHTKTNINSLKRLVWQWHTI